jgi:D-sedoheptulose 7-phosphate isomerase
MSPNTFETALRETQDMLQHLPAIASDLNAIAELCARSLRSGGKILFCGNGGSAAESQHLATEFVVRLSSARNRGALPAIALTTDTSLLTACSNDFGFEQVFARQIEALAKPGDVLILLSTSGKSPNLLAAARAAQQRKVISIAFLGENESPLDNLCTHTLHIPSASTQRVQEGHLLCGHLLVELVENLLSAEGALP